MSIKDWPGGFVQPVPPTPSGPYQDSSADGVWTLDQVAYWVNQGLWPIPGNINPSSFIENLFSTYTYTGNGSTQTITNGINLSGEGGLVWIKGRSQTNSTHLMVDTLRGNRQILSSNSTQPQLQAATTEGVTSFNSNGFSLGTNYSAAILSNTSSATYASWTFRKQPKFFDVVTYTGNGTSQNISHNLASTPGCIFVKQTNTTRSWQVWHRGLSSSTQSYLELNGTGAANTSASLWNNTAPTSTVFSVGSNPSTNENGGTYVAYLFAHDAGGFGLTGSENVISCGSYTGNGSATGPVITLGYEPQWLIIKKSSAGGTGWYMLDVFRGFAMGSDDAYLYANLADAEVGGANDVSPNPTGFNLTSTNTRVNENAQTYVYIAIRRGPMQTPTLGTTVFSPNAVSPSAVTTVNTGFPPDLIIAAERSKLNQNATVVFDRIRGTRDVAGGGKWIATNQNNNENSDYGQNISRMTNYVDQYFYTAVGTTSPVIYWNFRRASGFFDIASYTGTGAQQNISHNLGVAPELIFIKDTNIGLNGAVYAAPTGNTKRLHLFSNLGDSQPLTDSTVWANTSPTASVFTIGTNVDVSWSGGNFIAYLFASVPGVSKIGTYTGTGGTQTIDCGFTTGARFVMIKSLNAGGGTQWYVWDSARGIVAANDPYLRWNSTAAEVTSTDYVDATSSGFIVNGNVSDINGSGTTFLFFAIA